jgi:hypothetical protein
MLLRKVWEPLASQRPQQQDNGDDKEQQAVRHHWQCIRRGTVVGAILVSSIAGNICRIMRGSEWVRGI